MSKYIAKYAKTHLGFAEGPFNDEAAIRFTSQYATKLLRLVVTDSEIRGMSPTIERTTKRKNER